MHGKNKIKIENSVIVGTLRADEWAILVQEKQD